MNDPLPEITTLCPECGPGVAADEDGCCASCGATLCLPEALRFVNDVVEARTRARISARWATRERLAADFLRPAASPRVRQAYDRCAAVIGDAVQGQLVLASGEGYAYPVVRAACLTALCDLVVALGPEQEDGQLCDELREQLKAQRQAVPEPAPACPQCTQPLAFTCPCCGWEGEQVDVYFGRKRCPLCGGQATRICDACGWEGEPA
jgi:hypothetical protein